MSDIEGCPPWCDGHPNGSVDKHVGLLAEIPPDDAHKGRRVNVVLEALSTPNPDTRVVLQELVLGVRERENREIALSWRQVGEVLSVVVEARRKWGL